MLDAFGDNGAGNGRLQSTDTCSNVLTKVTALRDTVTRADGDQASPQAIGGPDNAFTVYQQQACTSPRLVLIPIVSGNGATRTIDGFTAVYITGCTDSGDDHGPGNTMNDCTDSNRGSNDRSGYHGSHDHHEGDDTRVWGIVLRVYLAGSGVQDIGGIDHDNVGGASALGIQTVNDPKSGN